MYVLGILLRSYMYSLSIEPVRGASSSLVHSFEFARHALLLKHFKHVEKKSYEVRFARNRAQGRDQNSDFLGPQPPES